MSYNGQGELGRFGGAVVGEKFDMCSSKGLFLSSPSICNTCCVTLFLFNPSCRLIAAAISPVSNSLAAGNLYIII